MGHGRPPGVQVVETQSHIQGHPATQPVPGQGRRVAPQGRVEVAACGVGVRRPRQLLGSCQGEGSGGWKGGPLKVGVSCSERGQCKEDTLQLVSARFVARPHNMWLLRPPPPPPPLTPHPSSAQSRRRGCQAPGRHRSTAHRGRRVRRQRQRW